MQIQLSNGLSHFYQWDTGQKVKAPDGVETIHFRIDNDHAAPITVANGWAAVPDECFQSGNDLVYYAYDENHTTDSARAEVVKRPKPTDYVGTTVDKTVLEQLDERIKVLENGGGVAGVSSVNGQTGAVTITAEGLGALTEDSLQTATDAALKQAKESGEFDGAPGPTGAGLDVTGATVGQTVKVSAVDSNGVPTAWEPVDMASGGETPWELLATISITENIVTLTSTLPKACTEVTLYFHGIKTASNAQLVVNGSGSANNFVTTSAKYIEVQLKMLAGQDKIMRTDVDHGVYGFWQSANLTSRLADSTISGITEISIYTSNPVGVEFTAGTIYVYGR